jgi:hypothetical protein
MCRDRTRWLGFLDTYRTMCLAPQPDFRRVFENIRAMQQLEMATRWL